MALTDATIVFRSLRARLFSTVITVLSVAVAVALLVTLLSLRDASRQAFNRGSGNMHLLLSGDRDPMVAVLNSIFYVNAPRNAIDWATYEQIVRTNPLAFAIPTALGDSYRGLPVVATTTQFFERFEPVVGEPWVFREGRAFDGPFEVVLGSEAARATGLRVGDELAFTHGYGSGDQAVGRGATPDDGTHVHDEFMCRVVGILQRSGTPHDRALFTALETSWIVHAHDARRGGFPREALDEPGFGLEPHEKLITGVYARVLTRPDRETGPQVQATFERLRRGGTVTVASPVNQINRLFEIVGNIDQVLLAMAGVVLLSSGVSILLALYNSMEQRRRQVAVMRVLGASRGRILTLVLNESVLLGVLGACAGVLAGLLGAQLVAGILEARLGVRVEPGLPLLWTLGVAIAATTLAAVAGLIPALMAYRTSVAAHLRPVA